MKGEFERKDTGKNVDHEYENITLDMNGIKITNLTDRANNSFSLIIHDLSNFRLTKANHNMTYRKINSSKKNL